MPIDSPGLRLTILRVALPLWILGFMATRLVHAPYWIGQAGFSVPDLGTHWAQPLYIPPVPDALAWLIAGLMVLSGLATAAGWRVRWSAFVFASTLLFVLLADRLASFSVSKLAPVLMLTLALGWAPGDPRLARNALRFIQAMLATIYCASGICKARGDWLSRNDVIWTHLHSSYQTEFAYWIGQTVPEWGFIGLQWAVLIFETGAPLWLFWQPTRSFAVVFAVGMHMAIGLMFGPVIWFSLLMATIAVAGFAPLDRLVTRPKSTA